MLKYLDQIPEYIKIWTLKAAKGKCGMLCAIHTFDDVSIAL